MNSLDAPTFDPDGTRRPRLIPESLFGSFGKYVIVEKLGQGGMGAVYLARDTMLDRQVAIKVPLLDTENRQGILSRFEREAKAAASLRHQNICPIFEFGEFQGIPFMVSPFLEGRSLQDHLDSEGLWPLGKALDVAAALADALSYSHQQDIIHRDIKPSNVLIEPNGVPQILDLGLAKSSSSTQQQLTHSGDALGTPSYMSPEQIDSSYGAIGPAVDIYSLGMTLYRLVVGGLPFDGDVICMIPQILSDPVTLPSIARPEVKGLEQLDEVIMKSLEKRPENRFANMNDFAIALRTIRSRIDMAASGSQFQLPDLVVVGAGVRYHPASYQSSIRVGRQRASTTNPSQLSNDVIIRIHGDNEKSLRISRQHFEIQSTQQGLTIFDRSQAGITINGEPAKKGEKLTVQIGDTLNVAGVIEFQIAQPLPTAQWNARQRVLNTASPIEATVGEVCQEHAS
jgi:serine/threonine protein kinase